MKKWNIVFLIIDGTRFDQIIKFTKFTQHFSKGTLFSKMITYAPYTIAAMHALFTGIYGTKNGVDNYYGSPNFHSDRIKTLPSYLKDHGYTTIGDTISDVVIHKSGFDRLAIHNEHKDNLTDRHIKLLNEMQKVRKKGKNFFLYLHYSNVHTSMVNNVIKKYSDFSKEYFSQKEKNKKRYLSYLEEAEKYFSELSKEFSKLGMSKDTIFIAFPDHGVSLGERIGEKVYGSFCYDYTLRCFLSLVGKPFPKKKISKMIRSIDIMPTILDLVGIEPELGYIDIQGRSVLPIIKNKEKKGRLAYSETGGLGGPNPSPKVPNVKSVRIDDWKLIYNTTTKEKELYFLKDDPDENINLSGKGKKVEKVLWKNLVKESNL